MGNLHRNCNQQHACIKKLMQPDPLHRFTCEVKPFLTQFKTLACNFYLFVYDHSFLFAISFIIITAHVHDLYVFISDVIQDFLSIFAVQCGDQRQQAQGGEDCGHMLRNGKPHEDCMDQREAFPPGYLLDIKQDRSIGAWFQVGLKRRLWKHTVTEKNQNYLAD
mmetsp:Transcript_16531/g.28902  ORF Transcript_16531/g.28902 Transcript_16531/m.28902 type:complete len:164 (+) Transcript_16531:407-898(+)